MVLSYIGILQKLYSFYLIGNFRCVPLSLLLVIEKGYKLQGPITPWFNQKKLGTQIMFSEDIEELIKEGK